MEVMPGVVRALTVGERYGALLRAEVRTVSGVWLRS